MVTKYALLLLIGVTACDGAGSLNTQGEDPGNDANSGSGDSGGETPTFCRRLDVMFSLDNSGSMQEEKDAMASDVFPAFANALIGVGAGLDDFRVGVLDACPYPATFHTKGGGGSCNFSSGNAWMESTSANLPQEFACVANVGSEPNQCTGNNDDEQPASSMVAALSQGNAGFLRDDALLVMVGITDEDEQPTPNRSVDEVYNQILATKGGDPTKVVFLGIGGAENCNGVYGEANQASFLKELAGKFQQTGHGVFWDLCQGQLEDGLAQMLTVLDSACQNFCTDPDSCEPAVPCVDDNQCPEGQVCGDNGFCGRDIVIE